MRFISIGLAAALFLGLAGIGGGAIAAGKVNFVGQPDAASVVTFDVFLPLRNTAALDQLLEQQQQTGSAQYHRWLTPQQFKARFGADAATVAKLRAVLEAAGLSVEEHAQSLRVAGPVAAVEQVLGTRLGVAAMASGETRIAAIGAMQPAAALRDAGARIVAFDAGHPAKHIHARRVDPGDMPDSIVSAIGPYWFTDLKQAYDYPAYTAKLSGKPLTGHGVKIGIAIDSSVLQSDLDTYFTVNGFSAITGAPPPQVKIHDVLGGSPFKPKGDSSFEASLDVQQSYGSAPGATVTVYNLPNLADDGILAGYVDIVEDNEVDVVSSSFGECELVYSPAYNNGVSFWGILDTYDALFKQGNAQGISWFASSGDSGGLGCPPAGYFTGGAGPFTFQPGVETPGSSVYVTAVGGTNLVTTPPLKSGKQDSAYVSENADGDPELPYDPYGLGAKVSGGYWGAGGGVSVFSKKPSYQKLVPTGAATRTVPDIGMQVGGCPAGISVLPCGRDRSAVFEYFAGDLVGVIGTSVSSPEFAGGAALFVEASGGRVGNLNNFIYAQAAKQNNAHGGVSLNLYHRRIPGFDGLYHTEYLTKPYNYITGNGTPDMRFWLNLTNVKAAGKPQTPTNP